LSAGRWHHAHTDGTRKAEFQAEKEQLYFEIDMANAEAETLEMEQAILYAEMEVRPLAFSHSRFFPCQCACGPFPATRVRAVLSLPMCVRSFPASVRAVGCARRNACCGAFCGAFMGCA
jgi:hypothetical protein